LKCFAALLKERRGPLAGKQWRTQKIFMGGSFSGIGWSFVFVVRCL